MLFFPVLLLFPQNSVLAALGFVEHDDNAIVRRDRQQVLLVEFLNQREDKTVVAFQFHNQVFAALGHVHERFHVTQHSTVLKGIADLLIQLIPVGQNSKSRGAAKLPTDLLFQEQHGIWYVLMSAGKWLIIRFCKRL